MKTLSPRQQSALRGVAAASLDQLTSEMKVTPWMVSLPVWRWIGGRPAPRAAIVSAALFAVAVVVDDVPFGAHVLLRKAIAAVSIFLGLYGMFFAARQFEKIYAILKVLSRLPPDTMARAFTESVRPIFGSINTLPPAERAGFGPAQLLSRDPLLPGAYLGLATAICAYALFATRLLPAPLSVGLVVQVLYDAAWALSFLWAGHFIVSLLPFITRIGRLPIQYFVGMPDSLSLKGVGGLFVALAWGGSVHFWCVLGLLSSWDVLGPHPGEDLRFTALVTFFTIALSGFYLLELFVITLGTQLVMSKTMLAYRSKRQAELAFHLEKLFDAYSRAPSSSALKELQERLAQGEAVLSRLPWLSLSAPALLTFALLAVADVAVLWLFVRSAVSVERLTRLWQALN